jgi:predicted enzyme related to lactoylglutathione lyase
MKFRYTILYVEDVAATMTFYEKAFGLDQAFLHESKDYGELATGDTKLAFSAKSLMRELGKSPGNADIKAPVFEIALETDEVAEALKRACGAGATLVQDATEMPWGQTISYVSDPNGILIEICTPVG